jgi:hypothetical protein
VGAESPCSRAKESKTLAESYWRVLKWQLRLQTMNWTIALIFAAIATVILVLKRVGQISRKKAVAYLKSGALVVDVRSPAEFRTYP